MSQTSGPNSHMQHPTPAQWDSGISPSNQQHGSQLGVPHQAHIRGNSANSFETPEGLPPTYNEATSSGVGATTRGNNEGNDKNSNNPFLKPAPSPNFSSQPSITQQHGLVQQQMPPQQLPKPPVSGIQPMFPPIFDVWFNGSSWDKRASLAMGGNMAMNQPKFIAELSVGWHGKMFLHPGNIANPPIISCRSTSMSGYKMGIIMPDGNQIEVKASPNFSKFSWVMQVGPDDREDRFRWRAANPRELPGAGWRTILAGAEPYILEREVSGEQLAIFRPQPGVYNGYGQGNVEFVAAGREGYLGAHWANVSCIALTKVIQYKMIQNIANGVSGAFTA